MPGVGQAETHANDLRDGCLSRAGGLRLDTPDQRLRELPQPVCERLRRYSKNGTGIAQTLTGRDREIEVAPLHCSPERLVERIDVERIGVVQVDALGGEQWRNLTHQLVGHPWFVHDGRPAEGASVS